MKLQRFFVAALLVLGIADAANAQQPLNLCCHPEHIRNWQPGSNPNDVFNVSKVPLARRFKESSPMRANSSQNYGGEICNSTILYPTCSLCPSQGEINNFLGYQPTYWQYMDKLVYWAGAASEGIINIPPAGSTDAAHAQGVKSLGNIFFPPKAFGGEDRWVREMLEKDNNGKYIFAEKLYQLCKYFNFDGWFINEETYASRTDEWIAFFRDFYEAAERDGNRTVELQWYDAGTTPNTAILRTHLNTSQFIEYNNVRDYRSYATSINCTREQTLSKIYAGIQCANRGATGWMSDLDYAMPASGNHVASLDLFCPEVKIWEDIAKSAFKSPSQNNGTTAHRIGKSVFENEEDMWINYDSDPSVVRSYGWKGVSSRVLERSAITAMPFLSDMGVGNGKYRFVEGVKQGEADWYHSGMQSILPTWRWWIENKGDLKVSIDWDDAYNVGSSFKIAGTLSQGDHLMRLYKTQIQVTNGGIYRVVYKSNANFTLEAKLSTSSSTTPSHTLRPSSTTTINGWTVAEFNLSELNNQTIYMLALNLKADAQIANFSMNLGQVAVLPANYLPTAVQINNLKTTSELGNNKGDIRVSWEYDWNENFDHFDIYLKSETGTRKLIGQTRGQGFYIPTFARNAQDNFVDVDVVPVMKTGKQQAAKTLKVNYPAPTAPTVTFTCAPKSYCVVGERVSLTANATGVVNSYRWTLPEGLTLAEGSSLDASTINVVATTPGKKVVTLAATNNVGTSTTSLEVLDVFASRTDLVEITNVVRGKTVDSYSGHANARETPANIIDGIETPTNSSKKWCNISADNEVVFDCQGAYRMYGFKIFDGNSGPEKGVDQIDRYTIEVSMDKQTWTKVVDRDGVDNISIKEDHISPIKGRYIRLRPHVNGTLRIWEFQAFGKADNNMALTLTSKVDMNAEETRNLTVRYHLNGDAKATQFTCNATANNNNITIGTITDNPTDSTFTIPVTAAKIIGTSTIRLRVNNGGVYKEAIIEVSINSTSQPNVLSRQTATVYKYNENYSYTADKTEYTIKGLTDGNYQVNALESKIQDASLYTDDVHAIFTAPNDGWNLSKIKISIPAFNQGLNEDGETYDFVNKDIKIAVGNDLNNLEVVHTFANLSDVSTLEYIFPEYRKAKYLAIRCNVNPLYMASLAEVEAYEQYAEVIPVISPLTITNWTHDVLVEAQPANSHANGALDTEGWAFYTTGIQSSGAIAGDSRIVRSRKGIEFLLADYTQNNAAVITPYKRCTLNVAEPVACEEVYILAASSNGAATLQITMTYDDNTTSTTQNIRPLDWYGERSDNNDAMYGLGRIKVGSSIYYNNSQLDGRLKFRIYEFTLPADKSKKVKSINVYSNNYSSNLWGTILAVSRKGTGVTTGIADINNAAESSKQVIGIYNINGMKLNAPIKGINIIKYADGTSSKILVQ